MKRVFITGASSGLGLALAQAYAAQGACLGLVARRADLLQALQASLPHPERHKIYPLDVRQHAQLAAVASDFLAFAKGIDIVIANAGVSQGTLTEFSEDLPVFENIMAINFTALVASFTPFIASMQAQAAAGERGLRLVGIASVAGVRGLPGAAAYSASKAAVSNYCEALRVELRDKGIKVVTLAPGFVQTAMTAKNKFAMPFLMPADKFAQQACRAIERGDSFRVIPWQMAWVARLMRCLPNVLYDFLLSKTPQKERKKS